LVLQFDSRVSYRVVEDLTNSKITLELRPVTKVKNIDPANIDTDDLILNHIEYQLSATQLMITVHLSTSNVRVVAFSLQRPNRIVLDFYQTDQKIESDLNSVTKIESVRSSVNKGLEELIGARNEQKKITTTLKISNNTPYLLDYSNLKTSTDSTPTSSKSQLDGHKPISKSSDSENLGESTKEIDDSGKSAYSDLLSTISKKVKGLLSRLNYKSNGNKLSTLLMLLRAFLLVDSILITYYVINRKSKRKHLKGGRESVFNLTSDEKPRNLDFMDLMKTSLDKRYSDTQKDSLKTLGVDVPPSPHINLKIESMINSLSKALVSSNARNKTLPEFEEIAQDIESLDFASAIPKELWIGRDGIEFLRNIKKMHLH
jgi:hypothetical protein